MATQAIIKNDELVSATRKQNTFQNKLRKYNGSAQYKARNYNHPKRKMEIEENSFVEKSPQVKKGKYLKDINDEITLKPFNLFK